jgi:hypothetical protein
MRVEAFFWILLSWVLGLALASLTLPDPRMRRLRMALAPPLGMGIVSLLEFLAITLGWGALALISELVLVVAISLLLFRAMRAHRAVPAPRPDNAPCPRIVSRALLVLMLLAVASFVLRSYHAPHGESDAMNIWNLHARFLFRDPGHWQEMFAPSLDYSHPDYPLLLPGFVASTWARLGSDTPLVPILVALGFAASLVALLYEALRDRGLDMAACLGTIVLVASPSFTQFASGQLADIPLACYYLASVILLTQKTDPLRSDTPKLLLAGFCVGLAAWTKNEGQLFLLLFLGCSIPYLHYARPGRLGRSFAAILCGVAPTAIALVYFKLMLAPGNDLVTAADSGGIFDKLLAGGRYMDVATGLAAGLLKLGDGFLVLILALLILLPRLPRPEDRSTRVLVTSLVVMTILGYAFVYIALSGGVSEHMATSLPRLLFQIWPLMIFALMTLNPILLPRTAEDTRP